MEWVRMEESGVGSLRILRGGSEGGICPFPLLVDLGEYLRETTDSSFFFFFFFSFSAALVLLLLFGTATLRLFRMVEKVMLVRYPGLFNE